MYSQTGAQFFDEIRVEPMALFSVQTLRHTVLADVIFKQTFSHSSCSLIRECVQVEVLSKIVHYNKYIPITTARVAIQSDLLQFPQKAWM